MDIRKGLFSLILILSLALSSCVFGKLTFSDGKYWIPRDFHPIDNILLIEQYPDKDINGEMLKYLMKNYRGKYEIVSPNMVLNKTGKYADTELFKFAFLWEKKDGLTKPIGHFYDRSLNKVYPSTTKNNRYQIKNAYKSYINTIDLFYRK